MGVDYYTCRNCEYNFPDCGYFFTCTSCEHIFCSDKCGGKQYIEDEDGIPKEDKYGGYLTTCVLCRKEVIDTIEMQEFLLKKLNLTYEEAANLYREQFKNE